MARARQDLMGLVTRVDWLRAQLGQRPKRCHQRWQLRDGSSASEMLSIRQLCFAESAWFPVGPRRSQSLCRPERRRARPSAPPGSQGRFSLAQLGSCGPQEPITVTLVDEAWGILRVWDQEWGSSQRERERAGDEKADLPGCHTGCALPASAGTSRRGQPSVR